MSLGGFLDEFGPRCIGGWIDDDGPVAAITVSVNGRVAATASPTDYRQDLEDAGIGDGYRGFTFPMSGFLTELHNDVTVTCGQEVVHSAIFQPVRQEVRLAAVVRAASA